MEDTFFLDTTEGSIECRVITNLYSEKRKKHYLVYEYVDDLFYSFRTSSNSGRYSKNC